MRRPGFTALEVLIATAVSVIVIGGAMALMGFLDRMSRINEQRFNDVVELGVMHETIRRAMQTLVAETPADTPLGGDPPPTEADEAKAAIAEREASERERESEEEPVEVSRPRFILSPQIPGSVNPGDPRRLEIVVLEQPAPSDTALSPTVRGVFELTPRIDGLAFQWRSIDPPGLPVILATRIRELRWTALAKEFVEDRFKSGSSAWRSDMVAHTPKEFPKALRLELVTMGGSRVDWLFEPAVTTGPEP